MYNYEISFFLVAIRSYFLSVIPCPRKVASKCQRKCKQDGKPMAPGWDSAVDFSEVTCAVLCQA